MSTAWFPPKIRKCQETREIRKFERTLGSSKIPSPGIRHKLRRLDITRHPAMATNQAEQTRDKGQDMKAPLGPIEKCSIHVAKIPRRTQPARDSTTEHVESKKSRFCAIRLLSIYLSIYLSVCLSVCLSIHPSIHPSIHSSIHLSIHPFIHLSIQVPCVATIISSKP